MSLDQDTNSAAYLTDSERDALITRMKVAWNALPPEKQAELKQVLDDAHLQLGKYLSTGAPRGSQDNVAIVAKDKFLEAIGMATPKHVIPFGRKPPDQTAPRSEGPEYLSDRS